MAWEILRAIIVGGIPVAVFTFLIVQWSIASGRMDRLSGAENLPEQHRASAKKKNRNKHDTSDSRPGDLLYSKIMSFGGGYYGTMAVLTYALIECVEIWQFLTGLLDPATWINRLGVGLIVEFLVNSITNLVAAFIWFTTLPQYIRIDNGWIWLAVTYGAYLLALQVTAGYGDALWGRLTRLLRRQDQSE